MPAPEEAEAAAVDVLAGLREVAASNRSVVAEMRMLRDEIGKLRDLFSKIEARPAEPIMARGPVPGTVPGAQMLSAGAELIRALNSGGGKKKKRSDG